jgi:hypothetical protein
VSKSQRRCSPEQTRRSNEIATSVIGTSRHFAALRHLAALHSGHSVGRTAISICQKAKGAASVSEIHFYVGFWTHCWCGISSSPPHLRLLPVTESVALPLTMGVHHMPECHFPRTIERSRCPKCEIRMMLVDVERSFAGPELRTLVCPKCKLAYKALADDQ